jgi:hypothetical protein
LFTVEPLWDAAGMSLLLAHARNLISSSWTQHAEARDADGIAIDPWRPNAVSWSLLGAVVAGYDQQLSQDGKGGAVAALRSACALLAQVVDADSLPDWNDAPERTQTDVLAALDGAQLRALLAPDGLGGTRADVERVRLWLASSFAVSDTPFVVTGEPESVATLTKARSLLVILLATCHETLLALEAAANVLDTQLTDDLRKMIERSEAERRVVSEKLTELRASSS